MSLFKDKVAKLLTDHEAFLSQKNEPLAVDNGVVTRYKNPVLTAEHTPVFWRYDLNETTNPYLMERIGMNATMNSGAIKWNGKYVLMVRVEGSDRKSFFAVAESPNGIDNFRFWDYPVQMPEDLIPATNIYDMRLTAHEDLNSSCKCDSDYYLMLNSFFMCSTSLNFMACSGVMYPSLFLGLWFNFLAISSK